MTNELNIQSLVNEYNELTNKGYATTYRKGEIISQLSGASESSPKEVGEKYLGIAKTQAYDLVNIYDFANEVPSIAPEQVLATVGTQNIRWLSAKSRSEQREEIQEMVNDGEHTDAIQSRIGEMKDELKQERPVKVDPRDEMIAMMSQHIRALWQEKLEGTLPEAIEESIREDVMEKATGLIKDIHNELTTILTKPVKDDKVWGQELRERIYASNPAYTKQVSAPESCDVEQPIPQEIIDEVLKEEEPEDMNLTFTEVEPTIPDHNSNVLSMRERLAKLQGRGITVPKHEEEKPAKVFVGYESEDEAFCSEWA